jgi:hypothetical protein
VKNQLRDSTAPVDPRRTIKGHGTIRRSLFILLLAAAGCLTGAWLCGCDFAEPQTASGGTGTEIVGTGEYPDSSGTPKRGAALAVNAATGLPVIFGQVFAYQQSFIPDTNWVRGGAVPRVYTEDDGTFRIEDAPPGMVVVQVNDGSGKAAVKTVNVAKHDTTYDIGTLTLAKTGAIRLPTHTNLSGPVRFYVSVKGTQLVARGTQTGVDLVLGGIPSGVPLTVNVRVYAPVKAEFNFPSVTVDPGLTTLMTTLEIK